MGELQAIVSCARAVVRVRGFLGLYLGFALEVSVCVVNEWCKRGVGGGGVVGLAVGCAREWEMPGHLSIGLIK